MSLRWHIVSTAVQTVTDGKQQKGVLFHLKPRQYAPRAAKGHQWLDPSDCQADCAVTLGILTAKLTKVLLTNTGQRVVTVPS